MPYKAKGKCVYKKDTGKKVGCTKGPVKKYLAALYANVKEMVSADVVGGPFTTDLSSNTDSYAPGDNRIPKNLFGGVVRRPGMKPKKKKKNLFESKFIEVVDYVDVPQNLICVTKVTRKNLFQITEDVIKLINGNFYIKEQDQNGSVVFSFNADNESLNEYSNRLNGLLGDRLNKHIFVHLEQKYKPQELSMGKQEEHEHSETIKKVKKNPKIKQTDAYEMIAKDHLKQDPKYYSKMKKWHS